MIWEDARDHDGDDAPGLLSEAVCFALCVVNAIVWPALLWLAIP